MNVLNYKKDSWHARLYKSTYNIHHISRMPDSICLYFWKLLFAIVIFPLYAPVIIIKEYFTDDKDIDSTLGFMMTLVFLLFGTFGLSFLPNTLAICLLPIATMIGASILGIVMLIVFGIFYFFENVRKLITTYFKKNPKPKKVRYYRPKTPNPLFEGFKSFKNKYCKRINWE